MDTMKTLAKGYIGIGVALLAIQLAAGRFLDRPACGGDGRYVLMERTFPRVDDSTLLKNPGVARSGFGLGVVLHVVRWAPDLSSRVLAGNMGLGDYLRGGYECRPAPPVRVPANPL